MIGRLRLTTRRLSTGAVVAIAQNVLLAAGVDDLQAERNRTRCPILDAQLLEQGSCIVETGRMRFGASVVWCAAVGGGRGRRWVRFGVSVHG